MAILGVHVYLIFILHQAINGTYKLTSPFYQATHTERESERVREKERVREQSGC